MLKLKMNSMNWIFNANSLNKKLNNEETQKISFTQKRKFSGEVGENIIILEEKSRNWVFTRYYEIVGIDQEKIEDDYNKITIAITLKDIFKEDKLIEDYSYSLLRVTDFKNPSKHYNKRVYNRIEDVEFEAIVNDKIYTNRTILGTILNALHPDHQKAFIEFLASEEPILLTNKTDVDKVLNYLYKYVESNIIEPIKYLKSSGELFSSIFGQEEFTNLGFAEDIESMENVKMVKPQIDLIEQYVEFLPLFSEPERDTTINTLFGNNKFRTLFRNSRLPLNLN
ncbi:hypothetical protein Q764_10350 [Flavobacterium suncheonense GH29-5 = DSM 17707]|uniref:Uncharacterized protein n=2 Tax=Flavobacterium suncheonense TaxID=350894 RepID=A0A0A2MBG9_9FLAO|nr:hypothetical protein Q764_10350 [Flavobacterium suncheonense GH29-5 = DSM 17707]